MSQFKKGAILSYVNLLLTNLGGLFLTPFIVKSLGDSEYGLYSLMGATVAYLTLMDFGLNNAIVRYLSKYLANEEQPEIKIGAFLGVVARLFFAVVFIILAVGGIVYTQLDQLFAHSLTADELYRAKIMFALLLINVAISVPGGAFQAIATAYQQFVIPRLFTIIKYLMRIVVILTILTQGAKGIEIIIVDTVLNFMLIAGMAYYVIRKIKVPFQFSAWDPALVKEVFSYSFWVFLYGLVHFFQWTGGQIILGMTTNTIEVGVFAIGIMLAGFYSSYAGVINSMLMPRAAQLVKQNRSGLEMTKEITRFVKISSIPMFLIFTSFIVFGRQFIVLWLDAGYSESYGYTIGMMVGMTLLILQVFANSILESLKRNRFKSLFSLFTVVLALITSYFLSAQYGGWGIMIPISTALVINGIAMSWYFNRVFKFDNVYFYTQTILKPAIYLAPVVFLAFYLNSQISNYSWLDLMFMGVIYTGVYLLVTYWLLLDVNLKKQLNDRCMHWVKKIQKRTS